MSPSPCIGLKRGFEVLALLTSEFRKHSGTSSLTVHAVTAPAAVGNRPGHGFGSGKCLDWSVLFAHRGYKAYQPPILLAIQFGKLLQKGDHCPHFVIAL